MELSETAFGYSKVSDLLQDQRFQDICQVQLQGHGYVVVRKMPPNVISLFNGLHASTLSCNFLPDVTPRRVELPAGAVEAEEEALPEKDVPVSLMQVNSPVTPAGEASPTWCLTPSTCFELSQDGYKGIVKNSFIQINRHAETPRLPVSRSMPNMSVVEDEADESTCDTTTSDKEADSSVFKEEKVALPEQDGLQDLLNEATGACTPMDGVASRTPCRSILRTSGPKKTARRVNFCLTEPLYDPESSPVAAPQTPAVLFPLTPATPGERGDDEVYTRVGFDVDELEEQEDSTVSTSHLPTLLTPGTMSKQGYVVSNTFLQLQAQPPTPYIQKESRRSKSVGASRSGTCGTSDE
jgi:hypothetical protein